MLLIISFGGALAIFPFSVVRFIQGEWLVGVVDLTLVVGMVVLGAFVYVTHKIKLVSLALTIFVLSGMTLLIHLKGPELIYWAYPTLIGVYFILAPRQAMYLTLLTILAITPALINKIEMITFITIVMTLVVNNIFVYLFASRMHKHAKELSFLVRRDPLTGVGNRRALDEKLEELIALNKRTNQSTSLIILDVDHFKNVNDTYGHAIGDQVLFKLTDSLKSRIRETDSLYRYGGEEFVVVLIGARLGDAKDIAEELRLGIESNKLIDDEKVVTISLGVAEFAQGETGSSCLERCDQALYRAKESGRNKVCAADNEACKNAIQSTDSNVTMLYR